MSPRPFSELARYEAMVDDYLKERESGMDGWDLKLSECARVTHYGLEHSREGGRYYASQADGHAAMIVALACEGVVWNRLWGLQLDAQGKVVEFMAPSKGPPTFAWLGDPNRGSFTAAEVSRIDESVRRQLAVAEAAHGSYVLGDDGELHPLH